MKILIIRFSSIGDIVLTTPIIRCIKQQLPQAIIHYVTKASMYPVLAGNPYIDQFFLLQEDMQPLALQLVKENYDVVIDLHRNLRSLYLKSILRQVFNSQVTTYTFQKLNIRKWLLTKFKINTLPDKSIVDRYFAAIKKLNVTNDGQGLDYFIPEQDILQSKDLPFSHSQGFIACSIGGQHQTKKMPVHHWKTLVSQIQYPLILLGGKEDALAGEEIASVDPIRIYNACGKFNINESAGIIQKARLVISHDTGLMHIAAAFKKQIISIWGNTVPALGMFPYYGYNNIKKTVSPLSTIIENTHIACRPCSKIGYSECPKKHFKCMEQIDMQKIIAACSQYLKATT